jgi:lysozyme family protein
MAFFEEAVKVVLDNEGLQSDDKGDPGGLTRFGITLEVLLEEGIDVNKDGVINIEDVKTLDPGTSKYTYALRWNRWKLKSIKNQQIATKIFDLSVNTGFVQCTLFVQRALKAVGIDTKIDGLMGPKTRKCIDNVCEDPALVFAFMASMRSEAAGFYRYLATKNDYFRSCKAGWLKRAYQ